MSFGSDPFGAKPWGVDPLGTKRWGMPSGIIYPLDFVGISDNFLAGYSRLKLREAYTGNACRVVAWTGAVEDGRADVEFIRIGRYMLISLASPIANLDATAAGRNPVPTTLGELVGSNDGLVTNWFDQLNSSNAKQPTIADMPRLVEAGVLNTFLDFDGSNDYLDSNLTYTSDSADFSVSLWIKGFDGYGVAQSRTLGPYASAWIIPFPPESAILYIPTPDTAIGDIALINDGEWHHVVITKVESTNLWSVYVDGQFADSGVADIPGSIGTIKIATRGDATTDFFDGQFRDIQFFSDELTAEEVSALYSTLNMAYS